ncbi:MAG: glycerate kinase [Pseudoclavibacter sp.]|nr:glycerate kinase [Pseudoclavibacter sp.]
MPVTVPHRVLIAPSGFKESLDSRQVAEAMARGVRRALPGAVVETVPMVDGGEGTAAALAEATGGRMLPVRVTGPVGAPVDSAVALLGGPVAGTAVVEMAAAAGLRLVPKDMRDPTATTTAGVGELIRAALDAGARRILVGCGDSGTSDGGAGALRALGAEILDAEGRAIPEGGGALAEAARLDLSGLDPRLEHTEIVVACNIHNVLTGPKGVARVFGPQKGASPEQVERLAVGLDRWAELLERECEGRLRELELDVRLGGGTGASGGLGAGLAAACGARLRTRFEVLLDAELSGIELDPAVERADLVLTAEGAIDYQTPRGKVPAEIARRAKRLGKPVIALAGSIGEGAGDVHEIGIDAIMGIIPVPMRLAQAIEEAEELVAAGTERALRLVLLGATFSAAA